MLRVQCLNGIPPPHASPAGSHSQSRVPSVRCIHVMEPSGNTPDGSRLARVPNLGPAYLTCARQARGAEVASPFFSSNRRVHISTPLRL